MNARQKAFVKLSKLFLDLHRAMPYGYVPEEKLHEAGLMLAENVRRIFNEYDVDRVNEKGV